MATGLIIADFGTMNNNIILTFTVFNILSYIVLSLISQFTFTVFNILSYIVLSLISQFRNRKVSMRNQ